MKLQVKTLEISKVTKVETADKAAFPEVGESEQPVKPQQIIAADRQRRQIKSPVRYGYTDIAYVLTVGDEMETDGLQGPEWL